MAAASAPFAFSAADDAGVCVRAAADDPVKGRCLVAARDFAPGEIVLRQRPYAYALSDGGAARCCDYCHRPLSSGATAAPGAPEPPPPTTALAAAAAGPRSTRRHQPILRCSRCKLSAYCDQACQRAAWQAWHREECAALAAVAPRVPPLTLRLAARALWRRRREQQQQQHQAPPPSSWRDGGAWAEVEALRDGWADGGGAGGQQQQQQHQLPLPPARKVLLAQMGALLARFFVAGCGGGGGAPANDDDDDAPASSSSSSSIPVKEAALLLSRIALNAHALAPCEGDAEPYGAALAPRCALLNHSPRPNAFQRFTRGGGGAGGPRPPEAVFVAIRPVRRGEELTVAYADVSGGGGAAAASSPLAVRRALRGGYLFDPRPEMEEGKGEAAGALAAALPLELGAVVLAPAKSGGGQGDDEEEEEQEGGEGLQPPQVVRVLALGGGAGARAAEAARRDPRAAALTALGGGLEGGVDVSFVEEGGAALGGEGAAGEDELLALLEGGPNGPPAAGGSSGSGNGSGRGSALVVSALGWGPWAERDDAEAALADLSRRFARAERLRARAEAQGPLAAARTLTAALRLVEDEGGGSLLLRLAPTQPLPMALRAALSDALFSASVLAETPNEQAAAWREARDGALAMERTAPPGWPALGLRLARAASLALRVAQDAQEEEERRRPGRGFGGSGGGGGGGALSAAQTAAEGAALAERALRILKASHGGGWGQGAGWIVRNQAAALDELRLIASGGGRR